MTENKTFHITTFGCQMNEHDSETLAGMLLEKGYQPAAERKDANLVILTPAAFGKTRISVFLARSDSSKRKKQNWAIILRFVSAAV